MGSPHTRNLPQLGMELGCGQDFMKPIGVHGVTVLLEVLGHRLLSETGWHRRNRIESGQAHWAQSCLSTGLLSSFGSWTLSAKISTG